MAKLPDEVTIALAKAEEAGWQVRAANGKIVIATPDGVGMTIGTKPNAESLKVWRSQCRKYNLLGDGPAMTPKQQEEMAVTTTAEPKSDPAAQKKAAEVAAAQKKAALATSGKGPTPGAPKTPATTVTFSAPVTPTATPTPAVLKKTTPGKPAVDQDGFPSFNPLMLMAEPGSYSNFKLKSGKNAGKYFCGHCWAAGKKETFAAPQGLSSHLGFRHAAFTFSSDKDSASMTKLPEALETALELLRGTLVEEMANLDDSAKVKELEKKVDELNGLLGDKEKDHAKRGEMLTELEGRLRKVVQERDDATKLAVGFKEDLEKAKAGSEEQIKMFLSKLEKDLKQMQTWANELAPVKAVGQIMEVVEKYLDK